MREFAFQPDRTAPQPLYRQLVDYIDDLIETARLPPGERLPPTRELATALGLGRNTVALAYEILEASGRVASHVGRGTFVASASPTANSRPPASFRSVEAPRRHAASGRAFAWSGLFAQRTQGLMRLPPPGDLPPDPPLDFRGGRVDPAALPVFELQRAYAKALQRHLRVEANRFDPLGYAALREEIARSLVARGIRCGADDVMIVNGAQQGLDLIARALVDPGDTVVVERPGYFGATLAFRAAQAHLLEVPVDDEGLRVDDLLRLSRTRRIKLIYTTPAVQMPTGVTLSDPRRRALLELADREQIPIVDDDYDGEFRVDGPIIPALKTADIAGQVVYVGTLTKILFPGLRLGYMVAAPPLLEMLARLRVAGNFQPALLDQVAIAEFMKNGDFCRHVRRLRKRHVQKRDALLAALASSMPADVRWTRPAAGSTIWIDLPARVDLDGLCRRAADRGLAFARGDLFALGMGETHGIGLMFGALTLPQIRRGAELLGELIGAATTPAPRARASEASPKSKPRAGRPAASRSPRKEPTP
jgi:DNA-binding transcriptional MocR family regulator